MNQNHSDPRRPMRPRRTPQNLSSSRPVPPVRGGGNPQRRRKKRFPIIPVLLTVVLVFALAATGLVLLKNAGKAPDEIVPSGTNPLGTVSIPGSGTGSTVPQTQPETEPETDPPLTYKEVTLLSAGDIMFHMPQVNSAYNSATGTYDFTDVFQYVAPVVSAADYAVVNFETTLSGTDFAYSGFPAFNSPDSALTAVKGTGFNMMLFANNHAYDHRLAGLTRTVSMFKQNGLDYVGARENTTEKSYRIVDIGGIKVGILNYADDLGSDTVNRTINGNSISANDLQYVDLYTKGLLPAFYSEVETRIAKLKQSGAELIVFYIHWGLEYYAEPNANQKEIAQKLCDLGADAIIGSHPHVVESAEVLTASDSDRQTICFYSLGNYVSNQNRETLSADYCHGNNVNTENGLMVQLTIRKYSNNSVMISAVDTIPTWVHRYLASDGFYDYRIIPLSLALENPDAYGLNVSATDVTRAKETFQMTNDLISGTVAAFNQSLTLPAAAKAE